jgi:hypothetical protein
LGGGKANTLCFGHGIEHIIDQLHNALIDLGYWRCFEPQTRVGILKNI